MSTRVPWGFSVHPPHGHLTAHTTVEERKHRAELGETAIRLLAGLGIGLFTIEALNEMPTETSSADMVAQLERLMAAPTVAPAATEVGS